MKRNRSLQVQIIRKIRNSSCAKVLLKRVWSDEHGNEFSENEGWTQEEVFNLQLMIGDGRLLETYESSVGSSYLTPDQPCEYHVGISSVGYDWFDNSVWWKRQIVSLKNNVLTILISVAVALLSSWALKFTGLDQ